MYYLKMEIFKLINNEIKKNRTCIESALIISPLNFFANSIPSLDFPVPVEPNITSTVEHGLNILTVLDDNKVSFFPINLLKGKNKHYEP